MNLNLAVKDKITATAGFKRNLSGRITSCGVEYSIYRGAGSFYVFLALKDMDEEKKIHIKLDVLCSAIKKSYLTNYISPLQITEETIVGICDDVEVREDNIEFTSGIGKDEAETIFEVILRPQETYLLTVR